MAVKLVKKTNEVVNTVLDDLRNLNIEELTTHIKKNVGEASDEVINLIHNLINS